MIGLEKLRYPSRLSLTCSRDALLVHSQGLAEVFAVFEEYDVVSQACCTECNRSRLKTSWMVDDSAIISSTLETSLPPGNL